MSLPAFANLLGYLLFFAIGTVFILYAVHALWKSQLARHWPNVVGEIKDAGFAETVDVDADTLFRAFVEYRYRVGGSTFVSRRLAYGFASWSSHWLVAGPFMRATRSYPAVTVRYNPRNPGEATILVGVHRFHIANLLFAFGILAAVYVGFSRAFEKYAMEYQTALSWWL